MSFDKPYLAELRFRVAMIYEDALTPMIIWRNIFKS